jgi:acetolactate synthase-1/2/3 large subunit
MAPTNSRSGGKLLIDQLIVHGADHVFCVPGESYLAALDAFADVGDKIKLITCRHEAAAANMAEAHGKLTGRPGICFVTRGPGACHAAIGLHTAFQDSTPMILFIGQIARDMEDREAFQEMDYRRFFAQTTKWVGQINNPDRIPEMVSQAFYTATAGRPGPVALALPEDMLTELSGVGDARAAARVQPAPRPADMADLDARLQAANSPVVLVGGGGWTAQAVADITTFAENYDLPVACSFRNQDRFNNLHPNYAGDLSIGANPELLKLIKESDLFMMIGPRLGEQTSQGYSLLDIPNPQIPLVHVHASAEELGRVYQPDLAINSGYAEFAAAAAALPGRNDPPWAEASRSANANYRKYNEIQPTLGDLDLSHVMAVLRQRLPKDAIITNDAGNFAGWAHRYWQFTSFPSQLGPTSGAMGYGVPSAIAAAITMPHRQAVCFVGDGGFLMSASDIATAMHYDAKPLFLVINNNMFGTIRMHQEREYPGRNPGTDLSNPDFAAYAQSFGAFGETVRRDEDFADALDRALASGRAAVLELVTDPEAITPKTTLTAIRDAALQRQAAKQ